MKKKKTPARQLDRDIAATLAKRAHAKKKPPQTYFPVEHPRGSAFDRAAFDLCRIDTTKLRALDAKQLDKAMHRLGRSFMRRRRQRSDT
jgi:hypothetical protein